MNDICRNDTSAELQSGFPVFTLAPSQELILELKGSALQRRRARKYAGIVTKQRQGPHFDDPRWAAAKPPPVEGKGREGRPESRGGALKGEVGALSAGGVFPRRSGVQTKFSGALRLGSGSG